MNGTSDPRQDVVNYFRQLGQVISSLESRILSLSESLRALQPASQDEVSRLSDQEESRPDEQLFGKGVEFPDKAELLVRSIEMLFHK